MVLTPISPASAIPDLPLSSRLVTTYNYWFECLALFQYLIDNTARLSPEKTRSMWKSLGSFDFGLDDVGTETRGLRLELLKLLQRMEQGVAPSKMAEAGAEVLKSIGELKKLAPTFVEFTSIVMETLDRSWKFSAVSNEIMLRLKAVDVERFQSEILLYLNARQAPQEPAELPAVVDHVAAIQDHVGALFSKRKLIYERHTVQLPASARELTQDFFVFVKLLRDFCGEWFKAFARCDWMSSDPVLRPIRSRQAAVDARTRSEALGELIHRFNHLVAAIEQLQRALRTLQSDIERGPEHVDFALAQFTEIKRNHWPNAAKKYEELLYAKPDLISYISALSRAYTVPEDALKYITDTANDRLEKSKLPQDWAKTELAALRAEVLSKTTGETGTRAVACDAVNQWSPWAPTLKDRWFACAQRSAFLIPVRGSHFLKFKVIPVPSRLMLYHGSRTLPPRTVPDGRNWFGGYRVALIYVGVDFGKELHRGFHEGIHAFQTVRELNVVRLMDRDNNAVMDQYLEHARSNYRMRHLTGFRPGVNAPLKRTSFLEIDREVFEYLCILWTKLGIHGYADDYEHDQGLHPEMMLCNPHGLIVPIDLPPWPPAPLERLSTKPLYYQFQPLQKT
eukprot:GILJ01001653.1.p1 GENE.GILJ01001653.1~~GILJ01001653.1.p1  ORF type:complete len:622 (-),score=60.49 GILJ01001653.1:106-1971(-)